MLQVERIILKGFTGMGLHEIEVFDFTITTKTTIILGGNGCGKTSLLNVFFPLCPAKTEFRDGGSYTNIALVDGQRFKFHVKFKDGSLKCTIINQSKDEVVVENVNPKVYNANVEDITGINKERKEMLNGEVLLTDANTELRRKWFTSLSSSDLTYAIEFYRRLRRHATQTNGAIVHITKKIAELKTRVLDNKEDRDRLQIRLGEMEKELEGLNTLIAKFPGYDGRHTPEKVARLAEDAKKDALQILKARKLPTEEKLELERNQLSYYESMAAGHAATVDSLTREYSGLTDEINRQEYMLNNKAVLEKQIETLRDVVAGYGKDVTFPELFTGSFTAEEITSAINESRNWSLRLGTALERIKTRERLRVVSEELQRYDEETRAINDQICRAQNALDNLLHSRTHYHETKTVECPRCTHSFKPGISISIDEVENKIRETSSWLEELNKSLEPRAVKRADMEQDVKNLETVREIVLTYSKDPVVCILLKKLQADNVFTENRLSFGNYTSAFADECNEAIQCITQRERLEKAEKSYNETLAVVNALDTALSGRVNTVRVELDAARQKLTEARQTVAKIKDEIAQLNEYKRSMAVIGRFKGEMENSFAVMANNLIVEGLNEVKQTRLDLYATARERWRQMSQELSQLAELEADLANLQSVYKNTRLVIQAWSPEKGALRKHYYQAIVRITEMMTSLINNVWSYPMRVMPCDMTDGDLDYTFPVQLKTQDALVPDVKKGSKAQRCIFNLAYRLTGYRALGMKGYPLLLDEPSEGMDETHRNALVNFIKSLINSGEFSQVIIVSHDADVHSKLNEASYCVIEPEGVTLPRHYNDKVKIVYADN